MYKFLKNILILFILSVFLHIPVCAKVIEFAQIGDISYSYGNHDLEKYLYFLNLSLKKNDLDFAVFLGDNVKKSTEENVIGLMSSLYPIHTPYYLVLGNNDAHKIGGIDKDSYIDIVTAFNHNQKDGQKYYYFKPNSEFVCVVLDDTPDFAQSNHGEVSDEQLVWLDNLLTKYSKKMFIIFQHSPLEPPREEAKLSMLNTKKYREVINKHSNIILMSSSHYQQDALNKDSNGIFHISAPAFFETPHVYQLIRITYDEKKVISAKNVIIDVINVKV